MHYRRLITALFTAAALSAPAFADINAASVAHQGIHRMEKLAQAGTIDGGFLTRLHDVVLTRLSGQPGGAAYQVTLRQVPAENVTPTTLELLYDIHGKNLKFTAVPGAPAVSAPAWPDAPSVTLTENAFHFVFANQDARPEFLPFVNDFASVDLSQVRDAQGNVGAQVDLHSTATAQVLRVLLTTKADVVSGNVVNP